MKIKICIIGLGYVGLPVFVKLSKKFDTIGYDINKKRIKELQHGVDRNLEFSKKDLKPKKNFKFTNKINFAKKCNFFIITVPTPILKNKKPDLTKKNIIICSKQFLQTKIDKHDKNKHSEEKTKNIDWLKKMSFDMRFIDESHNGGTTELAKKTLEFYGKQAFTIQITAAYSKPINDYNIPKDCWILWDLEDIKLCKNITNEGSIIRLVEKHGDCIQNIISKYSQDSIISEYSKYPELWLLTDELSDETIEKKINRNKIENSIEQRPVKYKAELIVSPI